MPDVFSALFRARTAWARRRQLPPALPRHDISILPGGHVVHHRICWCRTKPEDER